MAVKFCNKCNEVFQEGHVLYDDYLYCSEKCLREDNSENEDVVGKTLKEMFDDEIQYFTDWFNVEPYLHIVKVYSIFDSLYLHEKDALAIQNTEGIHKDQVKHKWILATEEEHKALQYVLHENGNTKTVDYIHLPFIHPEERTFNSLRLAREAYEEEEENLYDW